MSLTAWRRTATGRRWRRTRAGHSAVALRGLRPGAVVGREKSRKLCAGSTDESGVMQIGQGGSDEVARHRRQSPGASILPGDLANAASRHLNGEKDMDTVVLCTSILALPVQPETF
jgi:hypothetical protein